MSIVPKLTFGLVASAEALAHFEALATWMKTHAAIELAARPADNYKELATSVREGTTDIAWLPPVVYAWLAEGVTPIGSIVRDGETSYAAALVVREDSKHTTLTDLEGARAGWVNPWSAAGYVVPLLELSHAGLFPQRLFTRETFYGSHREALLALGRDECDVVATYARAPKDGTTATEGAWTELPTLSVRVLATFRAIPGDVLAVRRNLAPREYEHAVRAFRDVFRDDAARALAREVFGGHELHEGVERGHDLLRASYEVGLAKGLFD